MEVPETLTRGPALLVSTAENVDVGGRAGDGSSVLCHGESGNGYTSGRGA